MPRLQQRGGRSQAGGRTQMRWSRPGRMQMSRAHEHVCAVVMIQRVRIKSKEGHF